MTSLPLSTPYRLSGNDAHRAASDASLRMAKALVQQRVLRAEVVDILQTMVPLYPDVPPEVFALAGLLIQAPLDGHTCLDADALAERWTPSQGRARRDTSLTAISAQDIPALFQRSGDFCASWRVGEADYPPSSPIVEAFHRYYLHKTAVTEHEIAIALHARISHKRVPLSDIETLLSPLRQMMEPEQLQAAQTALRERLTLITGGPGTGKTWTVRALLALEMAAALRDNRPLPRIVLAAPTGKAAARVDESIRQGLDDFLHTVGRELIGGNEKHVAELRSCFHEMQAQTLHRLLKIGPSGRRSPRADRVQADIAIVDEVSMVDAPMMAQLLRALDEETSLILLGDQHQLASVEAGSVLADMVTLCDRHEGMKASYVHLTKSRRFSADSPVGRLAACTLARDTTADIWASVLQEIPHGEAISQSVIDDMADGYRSLADAALGRGAMVQEGTRDARAHASFEALHAYQLLCAHRTGTRSVEHMNQAITQSLNRRKILAQSGPQGLAVGMPIMVLQNDYQLQRFNGDIGVVIDDGIVSFPNADGSVQYVPISRMPLYRVSYAMTVHKSQGSEWEHVTILLPERATRLLSRELLYTALSRAKRQVKILGDHTVLERFITTIANRATGLPDIFSAYKSNGLVKD